MSLKDFQIISKLGEGAYSTVYRVKRKSDNCEYALKRVKLDKLSEKEKQNALNEVRILASCRHPNLIAYKEAFIEESTNSLCIIMEFADNGDLFQKITTHQKKGQLFPEEEIWNIFIQMAKALKPLHEMKIFHRDLKSANVFLYKDGTVKLGDMNVSKVAKKGLLYTQTGTPYYASPEVWKDQPYDQKSDIWSLGCVLYEMTTLKPPFRAEDMEGLYKKVVRGLYPSIPSHYSQDLANMIRSLLQVAPQLRPSCDKILAMSSVQKRMSDKHLTELDESEKNMLLKTIRFPKSLNYLSDRLPKANYTPLKTVQLEKHQFLQTLAGHGERRKERSEDTHLVRESESLDSKKKLFDKSSLPVIRAANKQAISLANSRSQPELVKEPYEKIKTNRNDKINEVAPVEEDGEREPRKKEEQDIQQKLLIAKERERKEKEKEKEREILLLREKAKQKAAEYQVPSSYLLLPDTMKSYKSNISKQSTTNSSDHLSEIRPRDYLSSKNDTIKSSSQSISVAVIKANQFRAGDGLNYIQGKHGKDLDLVLPRKASENQLSSLQQELQKIKNLKSGVDSPRRNQPELVALGTYKKKSPLHADYPASLELSSLSPSHRLHDPSKSKLPALGKNSYEITPIAEISKQRLKKLSKAYNVNLLDSVSHHKKAAKRDLPHLSLGVSGKRVESNPPLGILSAN